MTLTEIEGAELRIAQLKAKNITVRDLVAELCVAQEKTDAIIAKLNLQVINARLEFERSK